MEYLSPPPALSPGSLVWAYCRDSGGADQEMSIEQQRDELVSYCQKHGLVLAHVFADEAKSGKSAKNRDQFRAMLDLITSKTHPVGLLVWNLSRLARNYDDAAYSMAHLRRHQVVIHSLTEELRDNLEGRLIESVSHYRNAKYSDDNAKQVKRALDANVRNGYSSGGSLARGYLAQREVIGKHRDGKPRIVSRYVPDPELFPLAVLAFKLRAEGKSIAEITKATGGKLYKNAGSWSTFFANRTYLGLGRCGDLEVPDHHEAAVTLEDWEKVQAIRADRAARLRGMSNPHRIKNPTLLSGLLYCKFCGAGLVAHRGYARNKPYYRCGKRDRQRGIESCRARNIHQAKANAVILAYLDNVILTPDYAEELMIETGALIADAEAVGKEIKRKRAALAEINRAIRNLLDLAEAFGAGSAAQRLKEREAERAVLETEIKVLENRRENLDVTISPEAMQEIFRAWRGEYNDLMQVGNVSALRAFLTRFISKIEIGYNFETGQHELTVHRVWGQSLMSNSHVILYPESTKNPPDGGFYNFSLTALPMRTVLLSPCERSGRMA